MPKCRHLIVWWRGWGTESSSLDAPIDAFHYIVSPIHTRNKIKTKCCIRVTVSVRWDRMCEKRCCCVCVCQRHIPIAISLCENPISLLTFFPFVRFYCLWGGCCFLLLYIIGFCASTHTQTQVLVACVLCEWNEKNFICEWKIETVWHDGAGWAIKFFLPPSLSSPVLYRSGWRARIVHMWNILWQQHTHTHTQYTAHPSEWLNCWVWMWNGCALCKIIMCSDVGKSKRENSWNTQSVSV